jgi:hypothetical protein
MPVRSGLDQTEANNILNASLSKGSYSATVAPVYGRLMTVTGDATTLGTELTNASGSNYSQQRVDLLLGTASAGSVSNSGGAITWTNLPTATIAGLELWDSAGTPKRKWWGDLAASKSVQLGDSLTLATGALTLQLQSTSV